MSDEKTKKEIDIKILQNKEPTHKGELDAIKELKATAESGTNSYSSYNKKMIKALKKD
tara:strand:- start:301 stop:474 length:174 start_codon:yes stop_codon:yes gene_type:complete